MATDREVRPRTSEVWRHFEIKDDQNCLATCYYCRDEFSYRTTISNLRKHLKAKHKFAAKTDDDATFSEDEVKDDDNDKTSCSDNETRSDESKDNNKTNNVWQYFTVKERGSKMATCNLCLSEFSYLSISNLFKHLEQKHRVLFVKEDPDKDTEDMAFEKIDSDVDEAEKFENSLNMDMRNRKKYSAAWKHFDVQDAKLKIGVCRLCGATLSYRTSVSNLMKHVKRRHRNVLNISDDETDAEADNIQSTITPAAERKPTQERAQRSIVWLYFKTVDATAGLSQCLICDKVLSHCSTSTNLKKHLSRKHPNVQIPGKEDGSKRVLLSSGGQLYEVETVEKDDDDYNKNQSSNMDTVIEDFESLIQGNTAKRPKLSKRTPPAYNTQDTSSDDEVTFLNKYAKKKSDSGDYFGKYLTSLLKELPKEISMQLQTDIIRQVMNAQLTYQAQKGETRTNVPSTESTAYSIVIASDVPKEMATVAPEPFSAVAGADDGNKRKLPSLD